MLTEVEVAQFRAFGYVLIRGAIGESELANLEAAFARVMADAPVYNYFAENGTQTLMQFLELDPAFSVLMENPAMLEAMRDIWGRECLYNGGSDMWLNRDDTPWHTDGKPGRHELTLKVAIYLDEQTREQGSLNLIPGSHLPEYSAVLFRACGVYDKGRPRLKLDPLDVPGAVPVHTRPGDIVLWDNRLWHSAFRRQDGRARRTLFIGFTPDPGDDVLAIGNLRKTVAAHLTETTPVVYPEAMPADANPARLRMAERLEELGVENVR